MCSSDLQFGDLTCCVLEIGLGIGEIVTHALAVVADAGYGVVTVDVVGIDLACHCGSLLYLIFILMGI